VYVFFCGVKHVVVDMYIFASYMAAYFMIIHNIVNHEFLNCYMHV